jgi:Nucleotidyl transferase AbiEii toxin, Type IV TA system
MTRKKAAPLKNVSASVKARLLALARDQGEEFNSLLTRYVLERFLHRLAVSSYVSSFLLKGALLFTVWSQKPHRATRDIDLLGYGSPDLVRLRNIFCDICGMTVEDDGLRFDVNTVQAAPIREDAVYDGVRITFLAFLGSARVPVQVDVGFGDATEPAPVPVELPTLLAHPAPKLRGYRREVAIAEKLHAMVDLGFANSRMKDYFDIWFLSQHFAIDGGDLALAVRSTFGRRQTQVPVELPTGLTTEFSDSAAKLAQWKAFVGRTRLAVAAPSLTQAADTIADLVLPVFQGLAERDLFTGTWPPGGPWRFELPSKNSE